MLSSTPIVATSLVKYLECNQDHLSADKTKLTHAIVALGGMLTSVPAINRIEFEWVNLMIHSGLFGLMRYIPLIWPCNL